MSDNFALKIGIEGEKEFKNSLRELNSSFKVLASEMNLVTSEFDKNTNSIQSLTTKNSVLNKEIEAQKQKKHYVQAKLNRIENELKDLKATTSTAALILSI